MKIDGALLTTKIGTTGDAARPLEAQGFDGLLSFEGPHDPFLPLAVAAEHPCGNHPPRLEMTGTHSHDLGRDQAVDDEHGECRDEPPGQWVALGGAPPRPRPFPPSARLAAAPAPPCRSGRRSRWSTSRSAWPWRSPSHGVGGRRRLAPATLATEMVHETSFSVLPQKGKKSEPTPSLATVRLARPGRIR